MRCLGLSHLLTLVIVSTLVLGHAKSAKPAPEDETIPRNIVLRLLDYFDGRVQLLVGELPKQLPVELPLPDGAKVVASVMRQPNNYQILLDVPQSPEQVQSFYQERLSAAGWQRHQGSFLGPRGFTASEANVSDTTLFCNKSVRAESSLYVVARTRQQSPTDVRLNLNMNSRQSMCDSGAIAVVEDRDSKIPFPNLPAPPDAQITPGEGGGGGNSWYSTATVESKLDIQSLLAHYENQFKKVGWTKLDGKQSESIAWSSWTMKDKEGKYWQGVLNLRRVEGIANQYSASTIVF